MASAFEKKESIEKTILVSSGSAHKLGAVVERHDRLGDSVQIKGVPVRVPENPEQPIGAKNTMICALNRLRTTILTSNLQNVELIYAIESGIFSQNGLWMEICQIACFDPKNGELWITNGQFSESGARDVFEHPDQALIAKLLGQYHWSDDSSQLGIKETVGSALNRIHLVAKDNWMEKMCGISRMQHICNAMENLHPDHDYSWSRLLLHGAYRMVPDHPKEGVVFQDITPIFSNPSLSHLMMTLIKARIDALGYKPTHVAGPEMRGSLMAYGLSLRFGWKKVFVRKKGKLPPPTIAFEYKTEYSTDCLEIPADSLNADSQLLIVDDVLATGGSLNAVFTLFSNTKCTVLGAAVLSDVPALRETAVETLKGHQIQVIL